MKSAPNYSKINTHNKTLAFGKHKGELWTRVPVSYLRWMVNLSPRHNKADWAQAELNRRGISAVDHKIEISGHAIDTASLRVRKLWHKDKGDEEGLHAWLLRVSAEALEASELDKDGAVYHKGMKLAFEKGELVPILKTVMPNKKKRPTDAEGQCRECNGTGTAREYDDDCPMCHGTGKVLTDEGNAP